MSAPNKARHISFQNGQPALLLHNGGFVANRIIWEHKSHPGLMRTLFWGQAVDGEFAIQAKILKNVCKVLRSPLK
jgi:hypothetical protein